MWICNEVGVVSRVTVYQFYNIQLLYYKLLGALKVLLRYCMNGLIYCYYIRS